MIEEEKARSSYEFGPFVVDESRRRLLRGGETVPLTRKEFETLLMLVRGGGSLVTKNELMEAVWPDTHVEEGNLAVHISGLRRKLGRREDGEPYIETETGRGYRFNALIREVENFDLVIRKRTRSHIVTHEIEEEGEGATSGPHSPAPYLVSPVNQSATLPVTAAATPAPWRNSRRGALVVATIVVVASVTVVAYIASRERTGPERGVATTKTLAVLPFTLLNGAADDEYLGMGMTDALITRLSNVRQVTVRPTSAVRRFAGTGRNVAEAGRQLSVESVLEGSIQKSGDRVRVTAQLVRASDGATLWAGTFDEPLTNALALEDAISEQLAGALALNLTGNERALLARRQTQNADAYQLYLKGRHFWSKRTAEGLHTAIQNFRQAIDEDPGYAQAYAGLADCYAVLSYYTSTPASETFPLARAAAQKALELDNRLAEPYATLGLIDETQMDWPVAESEFRRALTLSPNYATAHHWYGFYLSNMGRHDEAIREISKAEELDPLSAQIRTDVATILLVARRYDEAGAQVQKVLRTDPDFAEAHLVLSQTYLQTGEYDKALEEIRQGVKLSGDRPVTVGLLGYAYAMAGRRDEAREALARLRATPEQERASRCYIAAIDSALGEKKQALDTLELAYRERSDSCGLKVSPLFDSLRSDPSYQALLRQANLASTP